MSETKTIKTLSSADSASELLVRKNGEVAAAPLSSLVAPLVANGFLADQVKASAMTVGEFKQALLAWVADKRVGATARASLAPGWQAHFSDDSFSIEAGATANITLVNKGAAAYFTFSCVSYGRTDSAVILKYRNGEWSAETIVTDSAPAASAKSIEAEDKRTAFKNRTVGEFKAWILSHAQASRGLITSFNCSLNASVFANFSDDSTVIQDGALWTWTKICAHPSADYFTFQAASYALSEIYFIRCSNGTDWAVRKISLETV